MILNHNYRYAVIGSNSFSGASFIASALEQGNSILGISRSLEPHSIFLPYRWRDDVAHRFTFIQLDVNKDADRIVSAIDEFKPDYIVNFAAQSMVAQSWNSPRDWLLTNGVALPAIFDSLRKVASIKKVVHASTPEVYGATLGMIKEDAPYRPSTPYAVSKAACDMMLMALHRAYAFPIVLTRSANVCGPGQQLFRIIPKTIISILSHSKLKLDGGGYSTRSFIDIRDVSAATMAAAERGEPGSIFHIATHRFISIRELVQKICEMMDVSFDDHIEMSDGRLGQDAAYLLDCSSARERLAFEPMISLEQTIVNTISWVKDNYDELMKQPMEYRHIA